MQGCTYVSPDESDVNHRRQVFYFNHVSHKTKDQNSLVFSNVHIYKLSFRNCFSEHLAF